MPGATLAGRVKEFDVAVVGRGIAGLSAAREILRETRLRIAVIGPDIPVHGSATIAAQGVSAIKGLVVAREPLFAAKLAGHRMLGDWIDSISRESESPVNIDRQGVAEIARDLPDYQKRIGRAYQGRFQGVFGPVEGSFRTRFLAEPAFGILYPEDLWFDPAGAINSLEALLRKASSRVEFLPKAVVSIEAGTPGDGMVANIRLEGDGRVKAGRVILAAGFATPGLLPSGTTHVGWRLVGGETFESPVLPSKKVHFAASGGIEPEREVSSFVCGTFSVTRLADGRIVAGSTTGESPGEYKVSPVDSMRYEIAMMAGSPGVESAAFRSRWGLRLRSKDRSPVCGMVPGFGGRLWVFSAFYKNGLQLAPFLAKALVQAIGINDEIAIPLHFRASRFGA